MQALLIDSPIYIFRSYFSLPENWHSLEPKFPTNAVYGFTGFLLDVLRRQQPEYIFCAFDESLGTGFRHQLCVDYKANRELPDDALGFQLNACRQLCRVLGVVEMASADFEADDLIGSMASVVRGNNVQPVIVSRDKDLMQLVEGQDLYWDFGKSSAKGQSELEAELDLGCGQMADYLALVGDTSDNIKGVPGIGSKTAKQLLSHFSDVEAIMGHLDQLQDLPIRGAKKLADKLAGCTDQLRLARELTTIRCDAKSMPNLRGIEWKGIHLDAFELFCEEMGFGSVFSRRTVDLKLRDTHPYSPTTLLPK
jgi:5'-3' exonuclease